jgi:integrase
MLPAQSSYFSDWVKRDFPDLPTSTDLGAAPADTNRDAMSLRLVRLRLQLLTEEINTSRRTAKGREKLFQLLRDRAMIAVMANLGLRRGAFNRLSVGDVIADYSFAGGEHGPAIVPRPGKTLSKHLKRPKGIPMVLFEWITEYCEWAGIASEDGCPLWLPNKSQRRKSREPLSDDAISQIVRSRFSAKEPAAGMPPETRPLQRAYLDEHDGRAYSPHQLRHLAEQLAFVVGLDWIEANRSTLLESNLGLPSNPQVFPDALLDHRMESMGALKDAESRQLETQDQFDDIEMTLARQGESMDMKEIVLLQSRQTSLGRKLVQLASATDQAEKSLTDALSRQVPVPDSLTSAELEALNAEAVLVPADETVADVEEELVAVREWASLEEFHWALGGSPAVSMQTIRRWARGERTRLTTSLRLPTGVNGAPPPCVLRLSERKQRVVIDLLNLTLLPFPVQENLAAIRYTPAPS